MSKLPEKCSVLSTNDLEIWRYFSCPTLCLFKEVGKSFPKPEAALYSPWYASAFLFFPLGYSYYFSPLITSPVTHIKLKMHQCLMIQSWEWLERKEKLKGTASKKFPTVGAGVRWNITIQILYIEGWICIRVITCIIVLCISHTTAW